MHQQDKEVNETEGINSWTISVILCCGIICLTELVCANTKTEKTVHLVLGAFLLCAAIIPVIKSVSISGNISFPQPGQPDIDDMRMQSVQSELLQKKLSALVESTLEEKGVKPERTDISLKIDDSGYIASISVHVVLSRRDAEKCLTAQNYIQEKLGLDCLCEASGS